MKYRVRFLSVCLLAVSLINCLQAQTDNATSKESIRYRFDLGTNHAPEGWIAVPEGRMFAPSLLYGFELGSAPTQAFDRGGDPVKGDFITAKGGFRFSVIIPEGYYKVTVMLGDANEASRTTIKSENRRLMVENLSTAAGQYATCQFIVHVRTPQLSPGNVMKLNSREWDAGTNQALTPTWDDKLTLWFSGDHPAICAIEIEEIDDVRRVLLIGDSTVTDGGGSWGCMLPRWFNMPVVVSNHAESGQTMKMFRFSRRWEKMIKEVRPGDYVFMQFGHNDSKRTGHDAIWPEEDEAGEWAITHSDAHTDYIWMLATNAVEIKRRGGIPVIVSPMTRINRETGREDNRTHGDYPEACRKAAELAECAFIDLNTMSLQLTNALSPDAVRACYTDATHSTPYGGYLFSRCIVEGIKKANLGLVQYLTDDARTFNPNNPKLQPEDFNMPPDPVIRRTF